MRRTSYITLLVCVLTFVTPFAANAESSSELLITPVVISEKGKARDIIRQSITVKNTSNRKLFLYPTVNDVNLSEGEEEFEFALDSLDRAASLANWIEISRGVVQLSPGEERVLPFVMRINLNAFPGQYHAAISLYEGNTRDEAESRPRLASVLVNLEVQADIKEAMQLNKFITDNIFLSGDDVLFNYQLQNIGNQELEPRGEIRIYNRKGEEVAAIDVNGEGKRIRPDEASQLASVWGAAQGFGKFKAMLNVNYGSQTASVQDTVFFWVIPWKHLVALFVTSLIAVTFFALYFHRWFEERHLRKLAHAGVLSDPSAVLPGFEKTIPPVPDATPPATATIASMAAPLAAAEVAAAPKRGMFSFLSFRRSPGSAAVLAPTPETVAAAPTIPAPAAPLPAAPAVAAIPAVSTPLPTPVPSPQARVPRTAPAHTAHESHGGTIDLKRMRAQRPAAEAHAPLAAAIHVEHTHPVHPVQQVAPAPMAASAPAPASAPTHAASPIAHTEGHVINLKKRQ